MRAIEAGLALYRRDGPRVRDGAAVAFGLALTLLAVKTPWAPAPRPVIFLAGTAGSAALWWRRRWPVTTALLGNAASAVSGNPWPLMVGVSTTASQRRDGVLVAVTAAAGVGLAVPAIVDAGHVDLNTLVSSSALAALVAMVGVYLGTRQELVESLRERAERSETERALRDAEARAGERARIAREMHDVLAHKVSLIALHAGALEVNPATGPARVEEVAGVIRTTAHQALDELRTVLGILRSYGGDDLAPQPQVADLRRLVDASREAGVTVDLHVDPDLPALPDAAARTAYRVVQEGLTNVHKHAAGAATVVSVAGDVTAGVTVSVVNGPPGAAGPRLPGSGTGLVGLGERVRLAGGRLDSGPEPDGGWRLDAWFPWAPAGPDGAAAEVEEPAAGPDEPLAGHDEAAAGDGEAARP